MDWYLELDCVTQDQIGSYHKSIQSCWLYCPTYCTLTALYQNINIFNLTRDFFFFVFFVFLFFFVFYLVEKIYFTQTFLIRFWNFRLYQKICLFGWYFQLEIEIITDSFSIYKQFCLVLSIKRSTWIKFNIRNLVFMIRIKTPRIILQGSFNKGIFFQWM